MAEPSMIAETPRWLAVNKPAGWLTVPGRAPGDVVVEWLRGKFGAAWPVHRLDRGTSGLILFARDAGSHRLANGWFAAHETKKWYDGIAQGDPAKPALKLDAPIEGRRALTWVEVRERFGASFLARIRIGTGRRHQIRIHLSGAGHPICGDEAYGGGTGPRIALHSARLELPGGEVFEAPWPEELERWVADLRAKRA